MAKEVRHVSSDTPAWGFWGGTFARPGEEDKGRSAGPTATGAGGDLRRCDPHRGGEDRGGWCTARAPDGLLATKPPGQPSKLNDGQRQAIARMIESGPIPAVHGVVRWRLLDLAEG